MNAKSNLKQILSAIAIIAVLGASSASYAHDSRSYYRNYDRNYDRNHNRNYDQSYNSYRPGITFRFGYQSPAINSYRYEPDYRGSSYRGNSYRGNSYPNYGYRSNAWCPGYGVIYYSWPSRACYRHAGHYHCD